jgi:UDP-2,4-diacetamido-2,4,6-trideoxy-beta-L-altropyranose hydrolase
MGFDLTMLPAPSKPFPIQASAPPHAHWLCVDWRIDAAETAVVLDEIGADWVLLDHYGLDGNWMAAVDNGRVKRLVIDDLADRVHKADLLVDQGIERNADDYRNLLDDKCQLLLGMAYALQKTEFSELRKDSLCRRQTGQSGRLLLVLGGYDQQNQIGRILETISDCTSAGLKHVDVVVGLHAPHKNEVQRICASMPVSTKLYVDTPKMPELMRDADYAICGAGLTSIESCVMGLPMILVVQADHQIGQARTLEKRGAAIQYNPKITAGPESLAGLISQASDPDVQREMSAAAAAVCDGYGLQRVVDAIGNCGVRR